MIFVEYLNIPRKKNHRQANRYKEIRKGNKKEGNDKQAKRAVDLSTIVNKTTIKIVEKHIRTHVIV